MVAYDLGKHISAGEFTTSFGKKPRTTIVEKDSGNSHEVGPILAHFVFSEDLNYPKMHTKAGQLWVSVDGVEVSYHESSRKPVQMILHAFDAGIILAYFLIPTSDTLGHSVDDVIGAELGDPTWHFTYESLESGDLQVFVEELFAKTFDLKGKVRSEYPVFFMKVGGKGLDELKKNALELYGLIEADPTYLRIKKDVATGVVRKDIAMVDGVSAYFMKDRSVVLFEKETRDCIEGITSFKPEMLVEEIKKSCTRRGLRPVGLSEETILSNSPYIDWLVELDALRVKDGLLARYSEELSQHHRSMKEVASIKSSISSSLDSYYAIRSIGFGAVRNAIESAEHEMMLDELLAEVHEKLELINGSLATYYDIENQTWNSIFAVIFAIFAFGSIATTFVFAYLPSAGFLVSVAIVAAATAASVCIVLVIVRTLTRRRASRR